MLVEIWSDVVCPWCYIGKRRFESALARFAHRGEVGVLWRSFELDRDAPARRGPTAEHLARKYGWSADQVAASHARLESLAAAEGLEYHLDQTQGGNTFDAHRLIHAAREAGKQDERPTGRADPAGARTGVAGADSGVDGPGQTGHARTVSRAAVVAAISPCAPAALGAAPSP
ncbi:MAG TPA: DsbA family oxidoreductase [Gaiellaceae bacterium]|nr:DsbA family oxidoreductase [Gaiellaceae bacterium]